MWLSQDTNFFSGPTVTKMANQPQRGFFGRMFGRGQGSNNSLTVGLKNAINRLTNATKNATTALTVNQVANKMNNKGANGRSVTNIFKKAIANQFQKAHAAVVAAAIGRVPQTAAAVTVNRSANNIKKINTSLLGGAGPGPGPLPPSGLPANVVQSNGGVFKKGNKQNNQGRNLWYPAMKNGNTGNWVIMNTTAPHLKNNKGNFTPIGPSAV